MQKHAPCKNKMLQQKPHNSKKTKSPQQPFNGKEVQRTKGLGNNLRTRNVRSTCRKGTRICKELRKKKDNVCCIQEVRPRGKAARSLVVKQRYKL